MVFRGSLSLGTFTIGFLMSNYVYFIISATLEDPHEVNGLIYRGVFMVGGPPPKFLCPHGFFGGGTPPMKKSQKFTRSWGGPPRYPPRYPHFLNFFLDVARQARQAPKKQGPRRACRATSKKTKKIEGAPGGPRPKNL